MTSASGDDTWNTFKKTAVQTNSKARAGHLFPWLHDQKVKEKQVKKNSYMEVIIQALCHSIWNKKLFFVITELDEPVICLRPDT